MYISFGGMLLAYQALGAQDRPTNMKETPVVKCRISTGNHEFSPQTGALVHVWVENGSSEQILIRSIEAHLIFEDSPPGESLQRGHNSYSSSVDPETELALKPTLDTKGNWTYPAKKLILQSGKNVEFSLDLAKLEWTSELSSALRPSGTLYAVAPNGTYEISLSLNVQESLGRLDLDSNRIRVGVQRERKKAQ